MSGRNSRTVPVKIANQNDNGITLKKGQVIGTYETVA